MALPQTLETSDLELPHNWRLSVIESTANLPTGWVVVNGDSIAEGVANMARAVQDGACLVSWNKAANLFTANERRTIASAVKAHPGERKYAGITADDREKYRTEPYTLNRNSAVKDIAKTIDASVQRIFDAMPATESREIASALQTWRCTSREILQQVHQTYGLKRLQQHEIRFQTIKDREESYHKHELGNKGGVLLRTMGEGDGTLYVSENDITDSGSLFYKNVTNIKARWNATLWTPPPYALTFIAGNNVAHNEPFAGVRSPAGTPRTVEVIEFEAEKRIAPLSPFMQKLYAEHPGLDMG